MSEYMATMERWRHPNGWQKVELRFGNGDLAFSSLPESGARALAELLITHFRLERNLEGLSMRGGWRIVVHDGTPGNEYDREEKAREGREG